MLSELREEFPADDKFQTMKVVVLPGKTDEGGPPTLKEIEQIENRYQLQTEGKAEYYGFDGGTLHQGQREKRLHAGTTNAGRSAIQAHGSCRLQQGGEKEKKRPAGAARLC